MRRRQIVIFLGRRERAVAQNRTHENVFRNIFDHNYYLFSVSAGGRHRHQPGTAKFFRSLNKF